MLKYRNFEFTSFAPPLAGFRVVCSPGTYVRSLAHDLGQQLGCGAHLDSLRRVRSGDFGSSRPCRWSRRRPRYCSAGRSSAQASPDRDRERTDGESRAAREPVRTELPAGLARIFNKKGEFLAVAAIENGWAHPRVVLTSITSAEPKASLRLDTLRRKQNRSAMSLTKEN